MSALYGLHPARFERRHARDKEHHEEVEVPWLLAVWPSYMARISPEPVWEENCRGRMERVYPDGQIFSLTERGVPTGWLLMSEEEIYPYIPPEDSIADILAQELMKEINAEIIRDLNASGIQRPTPFQSTPTAIQPGVFPGTLILKPDPTILPPMPMMEKDCLIDRLEAMGVIGVKQREKMLRAEWTKAITAASPTRTSQWFPP